MIDATLDGNAQQERNVSRNLISVPSRYTGPLLGAIDGEQIKEILSESQMKNWDATTKSGRVNTRVFLPGLGVPQLK